MLMHLYVMIDVNVMPFLTLMQMQMMVMNGSSH